MIEMFIKEDVKLAERPPIFNLAPQQIKTIKLMFHASETQDGFLFGYLSFSSPSGNVPHLIAFEHIPLNLLDTIVPEKIEESIFKKLWAELIWENRFNQTAKAESPYNFLISIKEKLKLEILTPLTQLDISSPILVANLFGKSKYGEELLINVALEKLEDKGVKALIKIRCRSRVR